MKVEVEGFTGCPHFNEASRIWREKAAQHPDIELSVHDRPRDEYVPWVKEHAKKQFGKEWKTSPMVVVDGQLLGGHDDTVKFVQERGL